MNCCCVCGQLLNVMGECPDHYAFFQTKEDCDGINPPAWEDDLVCASGERFAWKKRLTREEYAAKRKKTLYIDTYSSECGNCGYGAFPDEKTHSTRAGWAYGSEKGKGLGCGVTWEYVSSNYMGMPDLIRSVKSMRPDLEFWQ